MDELIVCQEIAIDPSVGEQYQNDRRARSSLLRLERVSLRQDSQSTTLLCPAPPPSSVRNVLLPARHKTPPEPMELYKDIFSMLWLVLNLPNQKAPHPGGGLAWSELSLDIVPLLLRPDASLAAIRGGG